LALAQGDLQVKDTAPDRYVVQRAIPFEHRHQIPQRSMALARNLANEPGADQNPHNIFPGDVLVLDRSVSPPQLRIADAGAGAGAGGRPRPRGCGRRKASAAHLHPALVVRGDTCDFAQVDRTVSDTTIAHRGGGLERAPRIIATEENRVNLGAGNVAYVSGFGGSDAPVWQIYRTGRPLVDPDNQRTLGFEAVFLGTAHVTRGGEPATVHIVNSKKEISAGDRLIPAPPPTIPQYVPHAPSSAVSGRIIGLYDALATSVGGATRLSRS